MMHPDFVRELSNQYQFEARERAARWRLGKLLRRRRQEAPVTSAPTDTSASGINPARGAEVPGNDEVAAESPAGSTGSTEAAYTEEPASLRDTPNLLCTR